MERCFFFHKILLKHLFLKPSYMLQVYLLEKVTDNLSIFKSISRKTENYKIYAIYAGI